MKNVTNKRDNRTMKIIKVLALLLTLVFILSPTMVASSAKMEIGKENECKGCIVSKLGVDYVGKLE